VERAKIPFELAYYFGHVLAGCPAALRNLFASPQFAAPVSIDLSQLVFTTLPLHPKPRLKMTGDAGGR
jgi:hypothetical protein